MLMVMFLSCEVYNETNKVSKTENGFQSQVAKNNSPLTLDTEDLFCIDKANELAFTLLKKQSNETPYKSFTFSPLSVSCALAMTSNGANGTTLQEIEALIGPSTEANSFYSRYIAHFSPSVVMSNYLAMNMMYPISQDFIMSITGIYNAQISNLYFGSSDATQQINDWIKQQSNGEFDNIVEETNDNELAYLINYMNFKALWENPFDKSQTLDREFINDDGNTTEVPTMFQYFHELYYENDKCQAISKKYDNSEYRMLIILPKKAKINDFLTSMNANEFNAIISGMEETEAEIDLKLPQFSTSCNIDLQEMLSAFMPTAFDERADFSRLSKVESYINRFTQDTKITVNEYGTEASGVTVQSFIVKALNPQFNANHPFIYFIYDETTHAILLAGQFCGN